MSKRINQISNYPMPIGATIAEQSKLTKGAYLMHQTTVTDTLAQWLDWSRQIKFYDSLGQDTQLWYDLLSQSTVLQLASVIKVKPQEWSYLIDNLAQSSGFLADVEIKADEYESLIYQKFVIAQYLLAYFRDLCTKLNDENKETIGQLLKNTNSAHLVLQLDTLAKECLGNETFIKAANRLQKPAFQFIKFNDWEANLWLIVKSFFENTALPVVEPYLTIYATKAEKLKAANEIITLILRAILASYSNFYSWAQVKINEYISRRADHQPHISLLLMMAQLKDMYHQRYNELVQSHTNFVFQEITQLQKQPLMPDTALVSMTLAKNTNNLLLPKGSLFKAGKNTKSKPIYYKSEQDLVLNTLTVSKIMSTVRHTRAGDIYAVTATHDAANTQWQANSAWLTFNDLEASQAGIAFESKMLSYGLKKGMIVQLVFEFVADLPNISKLAEYLIVELQNTEKTWVVCPINSIAKTQKTLTISAKIENDLENLNTGVNARLKLTSPGKDEQNNELFVVLYKYLLREPIGKIKVKMDQQKFAPSNVSTATGRFDGATSFTAFGTSSRAGSSFRIAHPFLQYASTANIDIEWTENLKQNIAVTIDNEDYTLSVGPNSTVNNVKNNKNDGSFLIKVKNDLTYKITSTIKRGSSNSTVETDVPLIMIVKAIEVIADLEEDVYIANSLQKIRFTEYYQNYFGLVRSLRIPFANKHIQKFWLFDRYKKIHFKNLRTHYNNLINRVLPFGDLPFYGTENLRFLPDFTQLGMNQYQAELILGLENIKPGQSISLLFEIADETAEQTEREAVIDWFFVQNNNYVLLDKSKILDTTAQFLQTGLLQLMLPEDATSGDSLMGGSAHYWLVARCVSNYEVVANIKNILPNGLAVRRVIDAENDEAQVSVAAATIENLYPKMSQVKSVTQNIASSGGRMAETDNHYFWRSSQRMRHKNRMIQQWDIEHLLLENFSDLYKVLCFNHAYYEAASAQIIAKPRHIVVMVAPTYKTSQAYSNFQPALAMSKLKSIEQFLYAKTSAFASYQVLNSQWDTVQIELQATVNAEVLDLPFYQSQLNLDLQKYLSPWAFDAQLQAGAKSVFYRANLVDFIDELPYINHIDQIKLLKNGTEVINEITQTSPIHIITSADTHLIILNPL